MPPELFTSLWLRIRTLVLRRKLDRDLDDELRFHFAMRQQKLEKAGLSVAEASLAARLRFGNPTLLRETARSLWTFTWLEAILRDLRYGRRAMARSPVFTIVAIVTLAFGIGANTAIFSVVNSVLLRAMPYESPEDIYSIREVVQAGSQRNVVSAVNAGNILEWTRRSRSFLAVAALNPTNDNLILGNESTHVHGLRASASLFPLLGIRPRIGRSFRSEEDEMGHGLQIVLTDALWRARFGSDPRILGQTISLNGYPTTVIGVLPASFYFPKQGQLYGTPIAGWTFGVEYFLNLNLGPWERKPGIGNFNFAAIGRLRPGVIRQQALAELETIEAGIAKLSSSEVSLHAEFIPLKAAVVGPAESRIWMFMAGAALVLAIVCVNLAGLMLGRNSARSREVAIRLALGGSRWTMLRQFIAEGLMLAAVGGAIGALAALAGVRLLLRSAPITLPRLESVAIDGRVLLFSASIALAAGLLFSLLPALRLEAQNIEVPTRPAGRFGDRVMPGSADMRTSAGRKPEPRSAGQCLVERGARCHNRHRPLAQAISESRRSRRSVRKLIHDSRELPGVASAGLVSALPLRGEMWGDSVDFLEIPMPNASRPIANFRFISPGYDDAIGLALVGGRSLRESDWGREVILISENLARRYPDRNLIGMRLKWREPGSRRALSLEVAGVVRDIRADAEKTPVLAVYVPYWIWPPWQPTLVVRKAADPAGVTARVQTMIRNAYSQVPITRVERLRQVLDGAVASRRFLTRLGIVFAASAIFLAALGLYGVVSLAAARRRHEIAIRMAVGASHSDIFRMVIMKAVRLTLTSIATGLLCGFGIERAIVSLLYDVRPANLTVYAGACGIVMALSLLASFLPALRAALVDPVVALKYE